MWVLNARLGDVNFKLVIGQGIVMEHADGLVSCGLIGHGYKGEALRYSCALLFDEFDRGDGARLREQGVDFILRGRLGQVSYVNSNIHFITAFFRHGRKQNDRNPIIGSAVKVRQRSSYLVPIQSTTVPACRRSDKSTFTLHLKLSKLGWHCDVKMLTQ